MSLEKAREYLKQFNLDHDIMVFDESSATVDLAARALHCEPCRIAKTLSFEINVRAIPLSLDDGSSGLNVIM